MAPIKISCGAPSTGRIVAADELKGLAIILVILYHAGGVLGLSNRLVLDLGVDIFVILSGIGLALSSREESNGKFLLRRLGRILPAYWIVLTLYLLLNGHFLLLHFTPKDILFHYAGIHGWFGDVYALSISDSFWFITLILSLYVFYTFARHLAQRLEWLLFFGAALALGTVLTFFYAGQSGSYSHIGLRVPDFLIGLIIGQLLKRGQIEIRLSAPLALACLMLTYIPFTQGVILFSWVVALGLMGAYVAGWKTLVPASVNTATGNVLRFFGEYSLEIFLIHQPLIREYNVYLARRWFGITAPTPTELIIGMVIGLIVTLLISVELHALLKKIPGLSFSRAKPAVV